MKYPDGKYRWRSLDTGDSGDMVIKDGYVFRTTKYGYTFCYYFESFIKAYIIENIMPSHHQEIDNLIGNMIGEL